MLERVEILMNKFIEIKKDVNKQKKKILIYGVKLQVAETREKELNQEVIKLKNKNLTFLINNSMISIKIC